MAAGLAGMVARVSVGRTDMEPDEHYREIDAEAQTLTEELMRGGREDSEAFGAVMDAFGMPKGTDDEKRARSRAIQAAMAGATDVPLRNGERCVRVLDLVARLEARFNRNAASDLEVGRALAITALRGCVANATINLDSLKNEDVRGPLEKRTRTLRAKLDAMTGGQGG
jgi:formiminotetrahydrofolate cyclodeaminase